MTGFQSHVARYLDDHLTVIVLTNLGSANPSTLVQAVANMFEPGIRTARAMKPKPDPDPKRMEHIRTFLSGVAKGVKQSPLVVPGLAANLDEDDQHQIAANLKGMKSLDGLEFLEERDIRKFDESRNGVPVATLCAYRLDMTPAPWFYRFWFTEDGKIADYSDKE